MMPDDPFGAPVGKLTDPTGVELKNDFTNIPGQNIDDMLQSTRVQPRQMGTGVMRGTQMIVNTDGSYITLGEIPDGSGDFGIAFFDANDTLIFKQTAETQYLYDKTTGLNVLQTGKLPDDTYGIAGANTGYDVEDGF